jgi:hypothetical protein
MSVYLEAGRVGAQVEEGLGGALDELGVVAEVLQHVDQQRAHTGLNKHGARCNVDKHAGCAWWSGTYTIPRGGMEWGLIPVDGWDVRLSRMLRAWKSTSWCG